MDTLIVVQNAINYMEDHLYEDMALTRIADAACMSVPNLYRVFYSVTGHPVKEYIRKRRVSEAARQLRNSSLPVVDIAVECGFESSHMFTKLFKKMVGITPGMYRQSDLIFSFERINVLEHVSYVEDRDVTEKFPDVKVIRIWPMRVLVYQHEAARPEGLETDALVAMQRLLRSISPDAKKVRYFGYNVDLPEQEGVPRFGYKLMAVVDGDFPLDRSGLKLEEFPGGLYAAHRTKATNAAEITAAWDRLLSEWLPRSTFSLGDHPYVEEYLEVQGRVNQMKLYLPVSRRQGAGTIEFALVEPFWTVYARGYGVNGWDQADRAVVRWLTARGTQSTTGVKVWMSHSYGLERSKEYWYEVGVTGEFVPSDKESDIGRKKMGGGTYACIRTGAFGFLTGVLEQLHRWLYSRNDGCRYDESRQWFAEYVLDEKPGGNDRLDQTTQVICYIPVVLNEAKRGAGK